MSDLISREAAIDAIGEVHPLDYNGQAILERIKALPTAEKLGKWIYQSGWFGDILVCSECGEKTTSTVMGKPRFNYCPNCGALMREDGEEDGC